MLNMLQELHIIIKRIIQNLRLFLCSPLPQSQPPILQISSVPYQNIRVSGPIFTNCPFDNTLTSVLPTLTPDRIAIIEQIRFMYDTIEAYYSERVLNYGDYRI